MLFKLSNLNSNLALTRGYLNSALNNSALYTYYPGYQRFFVLSLGEMFRGRLLIDISSAKGRGHEQRSHEINGRRKARMKGLWYPA